MKSLLLALTLVSTAAMAQNSPIAVNSPEDYQVEYLSWCEKNNVMAQNQEGQVHVLANCSESNLTCKVVHSYRNYGQIVTASCR